MKKLFSGEAFSVVRIRNFRLYLHFRMFLTMATLMQSVIVGWQIYDITHNVLWLGLIGLVEVIPQVSVSLFAGHFIDIWNRRKIINLTTIVLIAGAAILLIYSTDAAAYSARFGIFPILIAIFLTGLSRGIIAPAGVALLGQLVPRNLYANAATWNSANWQVSAVLGPAIGGLVYGFAGIIPAYSLVLALYLS
nr:MFS transporter [Bacteroidales bacterium]